MREFFKGWRRKFGLLMLVMALVLMGGWVRSLSIQEDVSFPINRHSVAGIVSSAGYCHLFYEHCDKIEWMPHMLHWNSRKSSERYEWSRKLKWYCGFGYGFGEWRYVDYRGPLLAIPYWSIVIPLTLISSFLLLTNSRKSPPTKTSEPITAEGA